MSKKSEENQVADAILVIADHGQDCGCTQCLFDAKTITENPKIVDAIMPLYKKLKP